MEANNSQRAQGDFDAAIGLVNSVPDLQFGKVLVMLSIAKAQSKGGMAATAAATLQLVKELALRLPLRGVPPSNSRVKIAGGTHYRDEAFQKMMPASIAMHNLGAAQELAKLWRQADSKANTDIIWAWLQADSVDDAIADAREIADAGQRAAALLVIAQELLNRAGAPNF